MRRHEDRVEGARVRAALAALGRRGRTTRIPDAVRHEVLTYARARRAAGASWAAIARAVGVSVGSLRNWARTPPPPRTLVPVAVAPLAAAPALVVVSPTGYRVEGLDLATVTTLLRALG
jgi:hypothetical protein